MGSNNPETGTHSDRPLAALTPRPIRLLLVGKVWPGRERAVREAQSRFPIEAATECGIDAVEAYIGSGYYALVFESSSNDMQQTLASLLDNERVKEFFAEIVQDVEGMPRPDWRLAPGDTFHLDGSGSSASVDSATSLGTASLPLAANMYRWHVGQQPQIGDEPHGGGS